VQARLGARKGYGGIHEPAAKALSTPGLLDPQSQLATMQPGPKLAALEIDMADNAVHARIERHPAAMPAFVIQRQQQLVHSHANGTIRIPGQERHEVHIVTSRFGYMAFHVCREIRVTFRMQRENLEFVLVHEPDCNGTLVTPASERKKRLRPRHDRSTTSRTKGAPACRTKGAPAAFDANLTLPAPQTPR
jgi:hypothetical protein